MVLNKYIFYRNHKHEKNVVFFALSLFDMLKTTFNFSLEERNLLKYSATLHDIGYFIDSKTHHTYTKNLILTDHIFNKLPKELRLMLAIVASGHRKKYIPAEIDLFNMEIKKKLLNLIALLRIADALDHKSILGLTCEKNDQLINSLVIYSENKCSEKLQKKIFKKTTLFKQLFSINIEIKKVVPL